MTQYDYCWIINAPFIGVLKTAVRSKKITHTSTYYEVELSKTDYRKCQWIEAYHSIMFALILAVTPVPALIYAVVEKWLNIFGDNLAAATLTFFAFLMLGCVLFAYLTDKVNTRSKRKQEELLAKLGWQGESPYTVVRSPE